jgi:anion-transporting  ArsA/GET3 family ATPase
VKVKENSLLAKLLDCKLAIFTGKGGVGKTSISAAFALAAKQSGKRVLIAEVRSSRRIPPLFGVKAESDGPLGIGEGLEWIHLTPAAALEVYAVRLLRFRSVYRAVFEQRAVRRFLRAIPSLAEILVLGHLASLVEEKKHDLVILDAPSSGPGALMLAAPREVMRGAHRGPLTEGAEWIQKLLADERQTTVNLVVTPLVVTPEELPVSEAVDLHHRLKDELNLPLGAVFLNRILEDPFPARLTKALQAAGRIPLGKSLASSAALLRARLRLQEVYLDRLRAGVDLEAMLLPEVLSAGDNLDIVNRLAGALQEAR